jgi:membrane protein DedA with SNARE-associated domain
VGITEFLVDYITELIAAGGYGMVLFLMALESMVAPVPSEAVMPFAGFLIFEGRFSFSGVVIASTVGSIIGSLISYYMGKWGGKPFVKKFGKYLLLDEQHLEITERFFSKYGDKAIFASRFIPVVRHLISIPAGVGRMNIVKFSVYTVIGAGLWNAFLTYVGYVLRENWSEVRKYSEVVDVIVVAGLIIAVAYFIYRHFKRARENRTGANPGS